MEVKGLKGREASSGELRKKILEMDLESFARLCNRLASLMGFKIRKSVYREDVVVLDAYMHIPGNALHYVIVFLRKEKVSKEELLDMIFSEETVELRWMIITTGEFEDDAKSLESDNVTLMEWRDFDRLLTNFGLKEDLLQEKRGEEAREGRYLPSAGELDSMLQWAEEFLRSKNYERALEYVNRALRIKETSRAKKLKAEILFKMGRGEEAIPLLTSVLEENVEDDSAWLLLGEILEEIGDYDEAEKAYQQCVRFNSRNVACWINRGNIMLQQDKYQEALLCYENALKIREDLPEIWNNRGIALKYLGKYDEALQSYNTALKFNPDFADAYLNKAYLYFDRRKYEKAQNEVMEYLKRKSDARGWVLLAQIYLKRGRRKDAEDALQEALKLEPGNLEARELLKRISWTDRDREKMDSALKEMRELLREFAKEKGDKELGELVEKNELAGALKRALSISKEDIQRLEEENTELRESLILAIKHIAKEKGARIGNVKRMKNKTLAALLKRLLES